MDSIARFFRSHVYGGLSTTAANSVRPQAAKALDCVFILGPGYEASMADELNRLAAAEGMTATVLGGANGVSRETIRNARLNGLIGPDTRVVCLLHGATKRGQGGVGKTHFLQTGQPKSNPRQGGSQQQMFTPTSQFLCWLREPLTSTSEDSGSAEPWRGTIHLASCYVASFIKECRTAPDDSQASDMKKKPVWSEGNVFLYGSSKPTLTEVALQNFDSLLRQLGECIRNGHASPDPIETFRRVMIDSPETVSLLGGEFTEPIVAHAPKTILQAMPGYLQAQWKQSEAFDKLKTSVEASSDRGRALREQAHTSHPADLPSMTLRKITRFFFTRLAHLKSEAKLKLLQTDLKRFPGLANLRNEQGKTPLMLVASLPFKLEGAQIDASRIVQALIEAGADVRAHDGFGKSVLHHAAGAGGSKLIRQLLDSIKSDVAGGKDGQDLMSSKSRKAFIDQRDGQWKTALHIAISAADVETVKVLLAAGADPDKRTGRWESPKDLTRRSRISDEAKNQIIALLDKAKAEKKMPRRSGA